MLIVCPECATSYEVDSAEVGAAGRKVRCAECGTVWRAAGAPPKSKAEPGGLEPVPATGRGEVITPEDFEAAPVMAEAVVEDVEPAPPRRRLPSTAAFRATPRPRLMSNLAAGGMAALAALGIWREQVVAVVPDLAGLYALVGLPVNLRGLEFQGVDTVETMEDGIPLLVVQGTIANVTDRPVTVPRMRLAVRGTTGREIYVWTAMPAKQELEPGETLPFLARLASPPADAREIAVRFISARDVAWNQSVQ